MSYSFLYAILVLCCIQVVLTKHTLHVDTIVPASGSTITLKNVNSDVFYADSADIQYISVDKTKTTGLVVDTQGPTSFGGSSITFDSTSSVNITSGSTLLVTTPEALSLSGDHWHLAADRFFSNVGGDFFLNTEGSITGSAWDSEITSDNDVDLHVAIGVFEALASEEFKIVGDQIEFVGDDKISLYSFSMLTVEAVGDFAAYADFIDFDSYGDIHLTSSTGNIEMDSVFHTIFEGDVVKATAPQGIDFKTEHGSIYVNGKDQINVNSAETIYLDAFDEIHFLTDQLFSIDAINFDVVVGEKFAFNGKTAEIGWGQAEISGYNIKVNTGGNIVLSLGGLTGNSQYNFNALEHIEFTSRNVFGNSDRLLISARQDLEIEVQDQIGSELLINSASEVLLYAGRNFESKNSRFDFEASETRVTGDDISFLSVAIVEDQLNFNAGSLLQATGKNIIGNAEAGIWNALDSTSINAGTFVYSAGIERDDLLFIRGENTASLLSNSKISVVSKLGELVFESNAITLKQAADASFTSREDTIILAPTTFTINAGSTATFNSNEAVYESNDLTYSARDNVNFNGSWFDLWASGEGTYTAGQSINWNAQGEVNIRAFADILIENISTLEAPVVNFEAIESADFTATGGITFDNSETFDLQTGSRSDFTFDGNKVTVSAGTAVNVNGAYVGMFAQGDIIFSEVNHFSVDTIDEESVHFSTLDTYRFTTTADSTFGSDDDILINQIFTGEVDTTATDSIVVNANEGVDWLSYGNTNTIVTGDIEFNSFLDVHISSSGGFELLADSLTYTVERDIVANSQGAFSLGGSDIALDSTGDASFIQNPAVANDDSPFVVAAIGEITYETTGSYTQTGGSTALQTASFDWESSQKVLHSSIFGSTFDANDASSSILFDASVENGRIRIESDDFQGIGLGDLLQQGGLIDYASTDSEPIRFSAFTTVSIESNANSPILWTAIEDFNVTALASLEILSHNTQGQKVGILIDNQDDIMSDTSFITRDGELEIHSLLTQLFQSEEIEFISGRDIHWSNFYNPADVGGVSITSNGSEHDGYYQDEVGIVVRSILPFGTIDFNVPRGQIDINSGYDLRQIIKNSGSNFTADNEITFWTKGGFFHLKSDQGKTTIDSQHQSVTFTTNKNTEIKSHDSYSVIAGKEIQLISNEAITDPNNDLSFEFSANNGNIQVKNQAGFDINFQGNDFYSTSAENSTFLASSNIPIVSSAGGISANGDTGVHKTVHNGDLYLTAAQSVNLASGTNSDIRIVSGQNSNWSAGDKINITSEVNTYLRSARGNILLRTNDTTGDLQLNSQGEIKFQSDGAAGNNQHGIFVVAPEISTTADRGTTIDAEVAITVGTVTRPIIQLEAGGDSKQNGVTFTSEGNVIQTSGFDFTLSANGYFNLHTEKDLSLVSSGSASITSLGTHSHGKNVVLESDGELKLTAGNIQINGEERTVVRGDELVEFKTTGNDASLSYISFNIVNDLISDINSTLDINSANWNTIANDYYNVYTFGAVEFENPTSGSGSVSIAADNSLLLSSNVDMDFKTVLPNSPISISSLGSNSNMEFNAFNEDADILFETNNTLTIDALDDFNLESTHTAAITAPMTKTGKSDNSNILFSSVDDIVYESGFDLYVQSLHNLTIAATDAGGAEIDIDSDGVLLLQSWQDSFYTSLTNEISFIADYNITFRTQPGHDGSILLNSTRDIVTTYEDGTGNSFALGDIFGDFVLSAAREFEIESFNDIVLYATGSDSNILFDAKTGRINIETDDFDSITGEAHTAANSIDYNVDGEIYLESNGIHNSVDFISDQGLLTFNSAMDFTLFTGSVTYDQNIPIESRNGHGYIDWQARGGTAFSIEINAPNSVNVDSSAYTNIWSEAQLNLTATADITFANGFDEGHVIISANSPGGNVEIYATETFEVTNNGAEGDVNFFATSEIGIFPFDDLTFTSNGISTDAKDAGILFETNHPLADFIMFTTDFLTADITVNGEAYNSYSRDATTYLLLDDDDTQSVGTYTFDAVSMKFSAESDITVQETSSGDIQIDTVGGKTFFTAGGDIIMNVREQLLLDVALGISVSAADDINFVQQQMFLNSNAGDVTFSATGDISIVNYDEGITTTSTSLVISLDADDNDVEPHSYDITLASTSASLANPLNILAGNVAGSDIILSGVTDTANLATVDFRHGLVIPLRALNSVSGNACPTSRDFYYDTTSNSFCTCGAAGTLICRPAYGVTPAAVFP